MRFSGERSLPKTLDESLIYWIKSLSTLYIPHWRNKSFVCALIGYWLKSEPSKECVKLITLYKVAIILHEGPCIISESCGFKCIHLISQVFAELPFLHDNFQMNYNPRNLGISTCEIHIIVYKFSIGHLVTVKSRLWAVSPFPSYDHVLSAEAQAYLSTLSPRSLRFRIQCTITGRKRRNCWQSKLNIEFGVSCCSCKRINHQSKSIKIHWRAVMATKICCKLCCKMYILMWQVVTSKTYTHLVYRRRQTPHKNNSPLRSFWTTKMSKLLRSVRYP